MTEPAGGIGTASGMRAAGLSTLRDVIESWAWDRGWPVARSVGGSRVVADGLADYLGRPWASCRVRKKHRCIACDRRIKPGAVAYRPLGEGRGVARRDRVCPACMEP